MGVDGSLHSADKLILHPNFNELNWNCDFGLAHIVEPFTLGLSNINAITLANSTAMEGTEVSVSGWGWVSRQYRKMILFLLILKDTFS